MPTICKLSAGPRFAYTHVRALWGAIGFAVICALLLPQKSFADTDLKDICPQAGQADSDGIPKLFLRDGTATGRKTAARIEKGTWVIVYDVSSGPPQIYWGRVGSHVDSIPRGTLIQYIYSTEKVIALVCKAQPSDQWNITAEHATVNDAGTQDNPTPSTPQGPKVAAITTVDRVFFVDPAKGNEEMTIDLNKDKTIILNTIVEVHRSLRFSIGSGLLVTEAPNNTFSVTGVPSQTTTTVTVNSTTLTNGVLTGSTSSTTPTITNGTVNYTFETQAGRPQFNAVAGLSWYVFGYDSFPISRGRFMAIDRAHTWPAVLYQPLGIYAGTSINELGNFTIGPSYEITPGVQVFVGSTWWNKTRLQAGIVACSGYNNSPSFSNTPTTTQTQTTTTVTGTPPNTTTTVQTTNTTTSVSMVTGCSNGNLATVMTGTTPLTQSELKPAFSWGFLFNTNLVAAFKGWLGSK